MRTSYLIALPLAATLALAPVLTGPALAGGHASNPAAVAFKKPTAKPKPVKPKPVKPTVKPKPVKPTAKPKPAKPVTFTVTGTLSGIDVATSTVTVLVQGGKLGKQARGTSQTATVAATAKISLDDLPSTLAALPVGVHVAVSGTVSGTVRTATKVNAETEPESPEQPEPAPTSTPTA